MTEIKNGHKIIIRSKYLSLKELIEKAVRKGVSFEEAELEGAYLFRSKIRGVNFSKANLEETNLGEADLRGAYFNETNLKGTVLNKAIIDDGEGNEYTIGETFVESLKKIFPAITSNESLSEEKCELIIKEMEPKIKKAIERLVLFDEKRNGDHAFMGYRVPYDLVDYVREDLNLGLARSIRVQQGVTQVKLAKILKCTSKYVHYLEIGQRSTNPKKTTTSIIDNYVTWIILNGYLDAKEEIILEDHLTRTGNNGFGGFIVPYKQIDEVRKNLDLQSVILIRKNQGITLDNLANDLECTKEELYNLENNIGQTMATISTPTTDNYITWLIGNGYGDKQVEVSLSIKENNSSIKQDLMLKTNKMLSVEQKYNGASIDSLLDRWYNEGKQTLSEIAEKCNVSITTIGAWMNEFELKRRPLGNRSLKSEGPPPFFYKEIKLVCDLSQKPEYQFEGGANKGKPDYELIALELNIQYHDSKEVRCSDTVQVVFDKLMR